MSNLSWIELVKTAELNHLVETTHWRKGIFLNLYLFLLVEDFGASLDSAFDCSENTWAIVRFKRQHFYTQQYPFHRPNILLTE